VTLVRPAFATPLCELLGIEYPILQSGMGNVAGPDLVAAVSEAGGLGILAGLNLTPDDLRGRIREVRARTTRPFGVNLWLHSVLRPPADPATIPDATVRAVQGQLDRFRARLGIPSASARPARLPDVLAAAIEVILEERVPVWSTGVGNPEPALVARCHEQGIRVLAQVATVADARAVAAAGVDVVVAQGGEAGGHRSVGVKPDSAETVAVGTVVLVPEVVDAVRVPVVAAGGIADGRGVVAALALGAAGVLLGTRFVATRESAAAECWKKAILERGGDTTTITDVFTGLPARALRNAFTEEYRTSGAPVLPGLLQTRAAQDVYAAAAARQDGEYLPMLTGQSAGLIHDLPGAGEVVETIVREALEVLARLSRPPAGPAPG
jgi:nitronate monooxygenase